MASTTPPGHHFTHCTASENATVQYGDNIAGHDNITNIYHGGEAETQSKLLRCLYSHYEQDKDRNPSRVAHTCEWLLGHGNFNQWRLSFNGVLLVVADPGCGKSVLAKTLIDEPTLLDNPGSTNSVICYFFFKDDESNRQTCAGALCAILHRLFEQKRALAKYAMPKFENRGDKISSDSRALWDILLETLQDPDIGEVICVIDALDEANPTEKDLLINFIGQYFGSQRSKTERLKFMMTSRPYSYIERSFRRYLKNLNYIFLDGLRESATISSEINLVIEYMVPKISETYNHPLKPSVQKELICHLKSVKNRTYLWLHLIFEVIKDTHECKAKKLKNEIERLPESVDAVYERIIARSNKSDRSQVLTLLHIIAGARKPLETAELNIAFAIQDKLDLGEACSSIEDLELEDDEPFEEFVRNRCGLLVTFDKGVVYLLHQTVKDFLLAGKTRTASYTESFKWKHSLNPDKSNSVLAQVCMKYLLFTKFDLEIITSTLDSRLPHFLEHSAKNWLDYYTQCTDHCQKAMVKDLLRLCDTRSQRFRTWYSFVCHPRFNNEMENISDPAIASLLGLKTGVQAMTVRGTSVAGMNAVLRLAVGNKDVEMLKLALDNGAEIDDVDKMGHTALILSARAGAVECFKVLCARGANVDIVDNSGWSAMLYSAYGRKADFVLLLLEQGAKANLRSALLQAIFSEGFHSDPPGAVSTALKVIIQALCDYGVDVLTPDDWGRTPRSMAEERKRMFEWRYWGSYPERAKRRLQELEVILDLLPDQEENNTRKKRRGILPLAMTPGLRF